MYICTYKYIYICSTGFAQCGTAGYSIVTEVDKLYGLVYFLNTCVTLVVVERLDTLVLFIEDDARLKVAPRSLAKRQSGWP